MCVSNSTQRTATQQHSNTSNTPHTTQYDCLSSSLPHLLSRGSYIPGQQRPGERPSAAVDGWCVWGGASLRVDRMWSVRHTTHTMWSQSEETCRRWGTDVSISHSLSFSFRLSIPHNISHSISHSISHNISHNITS